MFKSLSIQPIEPGSLREHYFPTARIKANDFPYLDAKDIGEECEGKVKLTIASKDKDGTITIEFTALESAKEEHMSRGKPTVEAQLGEMGW